MPNQIYTRGMLGIYELNRVELARDGFLWAYERSAARYAAGRQTLGDPDPFRLRYRTAIKQVVADVVRAPMNQKRVAPFIAAWAATEIAAADRARFIEVAETELMSLREGNYARYQVRPSEFRAWQSIWEKG